MYRQAISWRLVICVILAVLLGVSIWLFGKGGGETSYLFSSNDAQQILSTGQSVTFGANQGVKGNAIIHVGKTPNFQLHGPGAYRVSVSCSAYALHKFPSAVTLWLALDGRRVSGTETYATVEDGKVTAFSWVALVETDKTVNLSLLNQTEDICYKNVRILIEKVDG